MFVNKTTGIVTYFGEWLATQIYIFKLFKIYISKLVFPQNLIYNWFTGRLPVDRAFFLHSRLASNVVSGLE